MLNTQKIAFLMEELDRALCFNYSKWGCCFNFYISGNLPRCIRMEILSSVSLPKLDEFGSGNAVNISDFPGALGENSKKVLKKQKPKKFYLIREPFSPIIYCIEFAIH